MKMSGTRAVDADRALVWNAFSDPEILRKSLPGCESVEPKGEGEFDIVISLRVGPLKARFGGTLQIVEVSSQEACVLHFRGQGGAMGFVKGTANVTLQDDGPLTVISYAVDAQIGGKLAQLGSRMIDSVARQASQQFFSAFQAALTEDPTASPKDESQLKSTGQGSAAKFSLDTESSRPYLVPAWWLLVATGIGAGAALAGVLVGQ